MIDARSIGLTAVEASQILKNGSSEEIVELDRRNNIKIQEYLQFEYPKVIARYLEKNSK